VHANSYIGSRHHNIYIYICSIYIWNIYIYIHSPSSACTEGFWRFFHRGWWGHGEGFGDSFLPLFTVLGACHVAPPHAKRSQFCCIFRKKIATKIKPFEPDPPRWPRWPAAIIPRCFPDASKAMIPRRNQRPILAQMHQIN